MFSFEGMKKGRQVKSLSFFWYQAERPLAFASALSCRTCRKTRLVLEYLIIDCGAPLLGLEWFADYILVPIGGEGLVTGVSTLARFLNPMIKVIGVEPANANCMQESLTSRWKHSVRHIRRKSFTRWSGKAIDQRVFRQICDREAPKVQMRRKEQISVRAVLM